MNSEEIQQAISKVYFNENNAASAADAAAMLINDGTAKLTAQTTHGGRIVAETTVVLPPAVIPTIVQILEELAGNADAEIRHQKQLIAEMLTKDNP